ncbi:hypothetical protein HNR23_004658 [Nocardiopsis mwathae]|uniref:Uncharacterized protein n=1 Tax=Nocardiopsis mwathae TaxID=1472723 RepID=A0A7W9YLZ0_9ACTN|nr:hypothetical protein [Nocardiopsis mwathae]MBB6174598.1 hypothetical protein [Nocardiopsis mwathae]
MSSPPHPPIDLTERDWKYPLAITTAPLPRNKEFITTTLPFGPGQSSGVLVTVNEGIVLSRLLRAYNDQLFGTPRALLREASGLTDPRIDPREYRRQIEHRYDLDAPVTPRLIRRYEDEWGLIPVNLPLAG